MAHLSFIIWAILAHFSFFPPVLALQGLSMLPFGLVATRYVFLSLSSSTSQAMAPASVLDESRQGVCIELCRQQGTNSQRYSDNPHE